ncbi:MAG TPA: phosphoglycerate mutase family protein [Thermoanaerobaculia bacterium]|nr:phosphoglycerate mutase family protein [Thermoanaerobaculia bacterium]
MTIRRPAPALFAVASIVSALALSGCAAATSGATSPAAVAPEILLVRHAEAESGGTDPALTDAGRRRAEALADLLADEPLAAVLATDTRRARDTAAPTAERHGLTVEIYDPRRLDELAARLRERGGSVLVVGHSNTTPELARLLGGDPGTPIAHHEHDRLYRVDPATGTTVLERFGIPRPATSTGYANRLPAAYQTPKSRLAMPKIGTRRSRRRVAAPRPTRRPTASVTAAIARAAAPAKATSAASA